MAKRTKQPAQTGQDWSAPAAELLAELPADRDGLLAAAVAAVVLHWTVLFTVAIGCSIVIVMKGHAYVADAYPLSDRDTPAE